jgi:putative transposase
MSSHIWVWVHYMWSTKNRRPFITANLKYTLYDHIRENAQNKKIHLDFINGTSDHVHLLISLSGEQTIANIAQLIKGESSKWINESGYLKQKFEWQNEYIAVSVSKSIVPKVRKYIKNQEEHHRKKSFAEELAIFKKIYGFK